MRPTPKAQPSASTAPAAKKKPHFSSSGGVRQPVEKFVVEDPPGSSGYSYVNFNIPAADNRDPDLPNPVFAVLRRKKTERRQKKDDKKTDDKSLSNIIDRLISDRKLLSAYEVKRSDLTEKEWHVWNDFMQEIAGCGLVDTGCGKMVVGRKTLQRFESILKKADPSAEITYSKHEATFRFGGDHNVKSTQLAHIPITIADMTGELRVSVVEGETPLLISLPALKDLGAIIDTTTDEIVFKKIDRRVTLKRTVTGHYAIPLTIGQHAEPKVCNPACTIFYIQDQ